MRPALLILALLTLPLAACKKDAAPSGGNATGQILPGSISDAMLPEDRVTSQPPLDTSGVRAKASGTPEDVASAAPQEPAPEAGAVATAPAD